jgi:hypothetical protein
VSETVSYDALCKSTPAGLDAVTRRVNTRAAGGLLRLKGCDGSAAFGLMHERSMASRIGRSGSEATMWWSTSSMAAKAARGGLGSVRVAMTVGSRVVSATECVSYDIGGLSGLGRGNLGMGGAATVLGGGIGSMVTTGALRVASTASEATVWQSDSSVVGMAGLDRRVLGSWMVAVTCGSAAGSLTEVMSFDRMVLSTCFFANIAGTGAIRLVLSGSALGTAALSKTGRAGSSAATSTVWASDSSLSLTPCSGRVSTQEPLVLTVVQQAGSITSLYSYDRGAASSLSRTNGRATGGPLVTIAGADMASFDASVHARIGMTVCRTNAWLSDTSMICGVSAGVSEGLGMRIEVAGLAGNTVTGVFSYDLPTLSSVQPPYSPTTGNTLLYLAGRDFGTYDSTVSISVGDTRCTESTFVSNLVLSCRVAPGVGGSHAIRATMQRQVADSRLQVSSAPVLFSYRRPEVTSVVVANAPSLGGKGVFIFGDNFGTSETSFRNSFGGTGSESTKWLSHNSTLARVASGINEELAVVLSVQLLVSSARAVYSYDLLKVSNIAAGNSVSSGGAAITVQGINIGRTDYSMEILIGHSTCDHSLWISDSTALARTVAGMGIDLRLNFASDTRTAAQSSWKVSYDSPYLSEPQIFRNVPTTGSGDLRVTGLNFGTVDYTSRIRLAHTTCSASFWTSDSAVECRGASPGSGYGKVRLHIQHHEYPGCGIYYYDAPAAETTAQSNLVLLRPRFITVLGSNVGTTDASNSYRIFPTAAQASVWLSDTSLTCLPTPSLARSLSIVATAGVQIGSLSSSLSFDAGITPRSSSFSTNRLKMAMLPSAFTLLGVTFGDTDTTLCLSIGNSGAEKTSWQSWTTLMGRSARGSGQSKVLSITAGNSGLSASTFALHSYDTSSISLVASTNTDAAKGIQLSVFAYYEPFILCVQQHARHEARIFGMYFGHGAGYSPAMAVSGTRCARSLWISTSSLLAMVAAGTGADRSVILSVSDQSSNSSGNASFCFAKAVIQRALVSNSHWKSISPVTLMGSSLSSFDSTVSGSIGRTMCEASKWMSDSSLACKESMGYTGSNVITVSVTQVIGTSLEIYSYDSPVPMAVSPPNGRMMTHFESLAAGYFRVLIGSSFGVVDSSGKGTIGVSQVMATMWISDSFLRCKAATGTGHKLGTTVTVSQLASTSTLIFSFDSPSIDIVSARNSPTSGLVSMLISGRNLGRYDSTPNVKVGNSRCALSRWTSDSSVVCAMESGAGVNHFITSHVDGIWSQADRRFVLSYDAPVIHAATIRLVSDSVRSTSVTGDPLRQGHDLIELLGSSLGDSRHDNITLIYSHFNSVSNNTPIYTCDLAGDGAYSRHSVVRCYTDPAGFARNLTFDILVNSQHINGSDFYSYAPVIEASSLRLNSGRLNRIALSMLGGDNVSFTGNNFGNRWENMELIYYNPSTRNTNFSCNINFDRSNSTVIHATINPGAGRDLVFALVITSLRRVSQGIESFRFPTPEVNTKSLMLLGCIPQEFDSWTGCQSRLSVAGTKPVLMSGKHFGLFPHLITVKLRRQEADWSREYGCAVDATGTTNTLLQCLTPPGTGKCLTFVVEVSGLIGRGEDCFNYPPPELVAKTLRRQDDASPSVGKVQLETFSGGDVLVISAINIGDVISEIKVEYGRPELASSWYQAKMLPEFTDATVIGFRTSPGMGAAHQVLVTVGGQTALSVDLISYPADGAVSGWEISAPRSILANFKPTTLAGDEFRFQIQTRAINGRALTIGGGVFSVELKGQSYEQKQMIDSQDGWYCVMFRPTISGQYVVSIVQIPWAKAVANSPRALHVLPQRYACAGQSMVSAQQDSTGSVGQFQNVLIILRDCFGNTITDPGYHAMDVFSTADAPASLQVSFQNSGTISPTMRLFSTLSGRFSFNILLNRTAIQGTPFVVFLQAGAASAATSSIRSLDAKYVAGTESMMAQVDTRDANGNSIAVGGASVIGLVSTTPTFAVRVQDSGDGTYTVLRMHQVAGQYAIGISVNGDMISRTIIVEIEAAEPDARGFVSEGAAVLQGRAGISAGFFVQSADRYGNPTPSMNDAGRLSIDLSQRGMAMSAPVQPEIQSYGSGKFWCQYTLTKAGTYMMVVLFDSKAVVGSPFFPQILPADFDASSSSFSKEFKGGVLSSQPLTFSILPRDDFGNPTHLTQHLTVRTEPDTVATSAMTGTTATISWRPLAAGIYNIYISGVGSSKWPEMPLQSQAVSEIGPMSGITSYLDDPDSRVAVVGTRVSAIVYALSNEAVRLTTGGAFITTLLNSIRPADMNVLVDMADNDDGTYTASFTVTTSGTFSLSALLGNQALDGSPKTIDIVPGPTSAALTRVSGAGTKMATAGMPASMLIQARDEYGNPRTEGGDLFGLEVVEKQTGARVRSSVSDLGDGTYSVIYTVTSSGGYGVDLTVSQTVIAMPSTDVMVSPAMAHGPTSVA